MSGDFFQIGDIFEITNSGAPPWLRYEDGTPRRWYALKIAPNGEVTCAPLKPTGYAIDTTARAALLWPHRAGIEELL